MYKRRLERVVLFTLALTCCYACTNSAQQDAVASSSSADHSTPMENKGISEEKSIVRKDSAHIVDSSFAGKQTQLPVKDFSNKQIEFKTFSVNDKEWGYDIFSDGKLLVHQPNIPAIQGNKGFSSNTEATNVAQVVVNKIKKNIFPPVVSIEELDSMKIHY
jgi:hypothetical protein